MPLSCPFFLFTFFFLAVLFDNTIFKTCFKREKAGENTTAVYVCISFLLVIFVVRYTSASALA